MNELTEIFCGKIWAKTVSARKGWHGSCGPRCRRGTLRLLSDRWQSCHEVKTRHHWNKLCGEANPRASWQLSGTFLASCNSQSFLVLADASFYACPFIGCASAICVAEHTEAASLSLCHGQVCDRKPFLLRTHCKVKRFSIRNFVP